MWPDGGGDRNPFGDHRVLPHDPIGIVDLESMRTKEKDPNCVCSGNFTFCKKKSTVLAIVESDRDHRGALIFEAKNVTDCMTRSFVVAGRRERERETLLGITGSYHMILL